jgi:hypothetical protein
MGRDVVAGKHASNACATPRVIALDDGGRASHRVVSSKELLPVRTSPLVAVPLVLLLSSTAQADDPALPAGIPRTVKDEVSRTYHVLLHGYHAFLASTVGVIIANIKEPARPRYVAGLLLADSVNGLARLTDGRLIAANGPNGLAVIDVTVPSAPRRTIVSRLAGSAMGVDAAGTLAVVASGTAGVQLLELKDPRRVRVLDRRATPGYARGVSLSGDLVYVAAGDGGVQILRQVAGKLAPLSGVQCGGHVYSLALGEKTLYAAAGSAGVVAIDVSRPQAPRVLGRFPPRDAARGVALHGKTVVVVADGTAGLSVLDVSTPTGIREIGHYKPDRAVNRVVVRGDHVFVANDYDGLRILRLPATGDPSFIGLLPPRKK